MLFVASRQHSQTFRNIAAFTLGVLLSYIVDVLSPPLPLSPLSFMPPLLSLRCAALSRVLVYYAPATITSRPLYPSQPFAPMRVSKYIYKPLIMQTTRNVLNSRLIAFSYAARLERLQHEATSIVNRLENEFAEKNIPEKIDFVDTLSPHSVASDNVTADISATADRPASAGDERDESGHPFVTKPQPMSIEDPGWDVHGDYIALPVWKVRRVPVDEWRLQKRSLAL